MSAYRLREKLGRALRIALLRGCRTLLIEIQSGLWHPGEGRIRRIDLGLKGNIDLDNSPATDGIDSYGLARIFVILSALHDDLIAPGTQTIEPEYAVLISHRGGAAGGISAFDMELDCFSRVSVTCGEKHFALNGVVTVAARQTARATDALGVGQ
jgi:hypothetical protein